MPFALDSNPALSEISEALNYLLGNFGANLSADPNSGEIKGPTGNVIAYLYKYLAVKYADSADGAVNFSDSPTNRQYYGLRNTDQSTESTNPADYIWKQVAGGFGTTKFLWYQTGGGRQVEFIVDTVAPSSYFVATPTAAIDLDVVTGNSGQQNALPAIYQWTPSSTPPARPSTTSTYTWATATFTAPAGWSSSIPSAPGTGYYLWTIVVPLTVSINVTTSIIDWTNVAYPITAIGITGTAGATGPRTSTGYVYYQLSSPSAPPAPTLSGFNFLTGQFSTISANWSTNFNAPSATDTTKFWAVYYSVSEATFGGTQTVTVSTVFNWTNFNGLVTFTNLATNTGTTFIDGGNITTNTINTNRLVTGNLTAFNIQTAASGSRWQINGGTFAMQIRGFYASEGSPRMILDSSDGTVTFDGRTSTSVNTFTSPTSLYTISSQNTGGGNALWGRSQSGGNSIFGDASTSTGHGGQFKGNATRSPLFLDPQGSLPSNRAYGSVCFFDGWLCFANGTHWYKSDGTQLT
jgi:hypothetical protein